MAGGGAAAGHAGSAGGHTCAVGDAAGPGTGDCLRGWNFYRFAESRLKERLAICSNHSCECGVLSASGSACLGGWGL